MSNKCFCPIYNSLIERTKCFDICNSKINDYTIKKNPNYKRICDRCKYHKIYDQEITIDISNLRTDIMKLKNERIKS